MRCLIVLAVVALAGHAFAVTANNANAGANTETIPKCERAHHGVQIPKCSGNENVLNENCNSMLPDFIDHQQNVINHSHQEIYKSYEYLLLASRFRAFDRNRPGFFKVYKELSDKAWNNAIDLIKYVTQRGGIMTFNNCTSLTLEPDLKELESLRKVLDKEKTTAMMTRHIHEHASHAKNQITYDPELAHFIEEKYFEDQTETIRKLAGYVNDLNGLYTDPLIKKAEAGNNANQANTDKDKAFANYLFDEYLQK